jgi:hypothetical protein
MNASINAMRDRNERATREATTIIEAERIARNAKTERLRELRLAQEPKKPTRLRPKKPTRRGTADGKTKS